MVNECKQCHKRNVRISTPEMLCDQCMEIAFGKEVLNLKTPEDITFISKVAKTGGGRIHVEIPYKQRGLIDMDEEYIVILKKRE